LIKKGPNTDQQKEEVKNASGSKQAVNTPAATTSILQIKKAHQGMQEMADGIKIEFCLNTDDWETFTEQLELLFITRDIKDDKKAAHL